MRYLKLLLCTVCAAAITLVCSVTGGADAPQHTVRVALAAPELSSGVNSAEFSSNADFTIVLQNGQKRVCRSAYIAASDGNAEISLYNESRQLIGSYTSQTLGIIGEKCTYNGTAYDGEFEVSAVQKQLKIINILPLEDYVKGVMPYEIGSNHHDEITKAFAIMARTVAVHKKHSQYGFDVCATSCCQNYKGYKLYDKRLCDIVDQTKGLILTYCGEPISCAYCNSNGGASCSASEAWGGSGVPYLESVELSEEEYIITWQKEMTASEISRRAAAYGATGDITDIALEYSSAGFVVKAVLSDTNGNTVTIEDTSKVRKFFGLNSAKFEIDYYVTDDITTADGNADYAGSIITADGIRSVSAAEFFKTANASATSAEVVAVFDGSGYGHCVGFSLAGAKTLVKKGYKYKDIATFYFKGAEISKL